MKANFKQILVGLGIGTLAYYIAKKMTGKKGESTSKIEGGYGNGISFEDADGVDKTIGVDGGFGNGINFADANGIDIIDGEYYSADGDFYDADGNFYDADGDFYGADGSFITPEGGYGNGIGFMDANGVDEYSNAKGKGKKKRGKNAGLKRQLAIWTKKLNALTKAKEKLAPKIEKRIAQVRSKMTNRLNRKLAQAQQKVASINQRLQANG